jgi:hypothetical protein
MADPQFAALEWTLKPVNWSGEIEIRSALDGAVLNENVARYQDLENQHLEVVETGHDGEDIIFVTVRTSQSRPDDPGGQDARLRRSRAVPPWSGVTRPKKVASPSIWWSGCQQQKELSVEKVVAIHTSYDFAISEPEADARKGPAARHVRRAARRARDAVAPPLEHRRHRTGERRRGDAADPAPPHLPPAPDGVAEHDRPGRGRAGPRLARRGVPRPHLLGRALHLPVPVCSGCRS